MHTYQNQECIKNEQKFGTLDEKEKRNQKSCTKHILTPNPKSKYENFDLKS